MQNRPQIDIIGSIRESLGENLRGAILLECTINVNPYWDGKENDVYAEFLILWSRPDEVIPYGSHRGCIYAYNDKPHTINLCWGNYFRDIAVAREDFAKRRRVF